MKYTTEYENFGIWDIVAGVITRVWVVTMRNGVWIPGKNTELLYSPKRPD
jgi:hypothetical protein